MKRDAVESEELMRPEDDIFRRLSNDERWRRYCGFLDLSLQEFLEIQNELLLDQVQRVATSLLGRRIMGDNPPRTINEFRKRVPLTTYDDYEPYLSERDESALAEKPFVWCHSSGRGGRFKWIPQSVEVMDKAARDLFAACILCSASSRGEIRVEPGLRFLTTLPAAPYTSGVVLDSFRRRFTVNVLPPPDAVAQLPFAEQVARGFEVALRGGFDIGGAMAVVLVKMGEQMSGATGRQGQGRFSWSMLHPAALLRIARAWARSMRARRPIYPRDLWQPKGIMAGGVDLAIYRPDIERYWGVRPYDIYASSETMFVGLQGWNRRLLTLLPDSVFFEFLPHDPNGSLPSQRPTLLLDELERDRLYEVVITQFHGMPLLRYCLGDVIRVVSLSDEETGVRLPQLEVQRKVGEVVNLSGLCSLDERILSAALAAAGVRCTEWTALKEHSGSRTVLRMVVELKEERPAREISELLDARLKELDTDYRDVERYGGANPIRTTVLRAGGFGRYAEAMIREGRDLAHLKPNHVNAPSGVVERLLAVAEVREKE